MYIGKDFIIGSPITRLTFKPEDQRLSISVMIIDDEIVEETQEFRLFLSVATNSIVQYALGEYAEAVIPIIDNDGETN